MKKKIEFQAPHLATIISIYNGDINNEVVYMAKKLLVLLSFLVIFLHSLHVNAQDSNNIEIFDPKQNKVVKVVQLSPEIQNMVAGWITNINGMCGKLDPITDDGYAIRVPLNPPVTVNNNWLNAVVREVYILIPEKDPPFYLIFEGENKLSCFQFNGDVNMLSKSLDFKLKSLP